MRAHGQLLSGLKQELFEHVKACLEADPPPELAQAQGGPPECVEKVIASLQAMVARIMVDEVKTGSADDAEWHIKIFLNRFEQLEQEHEESGCWPTGKRIKKGFMGAEKQLCLSSQCAWHNAKSWSTLLHL